MRNLPKNKLWFLALVLAMSFSQVFYAMAQVTDVVSSDAVDAVANPAVEAVALPVEVSAPAVVEAVPVEATQTEITEPVQTTPVASSAEPVSAVENYEFWPKQFSGGEWQLIDKIERRELAEKAPVADFSIDNSGLLEVSSQSMIDAMIDPESPRDFALVVDNFSANSEVQYPELKMLRLRGSLAITTEASSVVFEYWQHDAWQLAGEINVNNETSNEVNQGYFMYALPLMNESEIKSLKVRISPNKANSKDLKVQIDSLWLEAATSGSYEKISNNELLIPDVSDSASSTMPELKDNMGLYFKESDEPLFALMLDPTLDDNFFVKFVDSIVDFFTDSNEKIEIVESKLLNPNRESAQVDIKVETDENGLMSVRLGRPANFIAGAYEITLLVKRDTKGYRLRQSFYWGVEPSEVMLEEEAPNLVDATILTEEAAEGHVLIKKDGQGVIEAWYRGSDKWQKLPIVAEAVTKTQAFGIKEGVVFWLNDDGVLVGYDTMNGTYFSQMLEVGKGTLVELHGHKYILRQNADRFEFGNLDEMIKQLLNQ